MPFSRELFVSNFIENQFPRFYQEEGPDFILFMKAYYEWLEDPWGAENDGYGGPVREARELRDYRDIDETIERFLEHFQKKYLYGIPFNVIANKRFLLKHILDVYRSKGTIQCYRLLFKLLYNEDIDVYLPGKDVLRVSDGTWVQPRYLEVTANDDLKNYVGKTIVGATSGVTATVENYVKENYNNDVINILYISNILPRLREFEINEKIVLLDKKDDPEAINLAPTLLGSLDKITIINGGQDYKIGDVIKIVYRDLTNNDVISYGKEGVLKVTKLFTGFGSLEFDIADGGFGYTANSLTFLYRTTANGQGASFKVDSLTSQQYIEYTTDLLCDYLTVNIDAVAYGFPKDPSANLSTSIGTTLSKSNDVFGTIFSLTDITIGNSYESAANTFVRSVTTSKALPGTLVYNTTSNTVTGTTTTFTTFFQNNDVIGLQSNSSNSSTLEYAVIRNVNSDTVITLYGPPTQNSTATAVFKAAPTILPSEYAFYEPIMYTADGSIVGENESVLAFPNSGNNIVLEAEAINSGKGYVEGEQIRAFLHSCVSNVVTISSGGSGYAANDTLLFVGGDPAYIANGYVSAVDGNGAILETVIENGGSGYKEVPEIRVNSDTGSGARLVASLLEFDSTSSVAEKTIRARVLKAAIGRGTGYYSTTRGFLDADKYIHDNYYYQDYSYEIKVAQTLNKYKDIISKTFHTAGSELFGKYLKFLNEQSIATLASDKAILYPSSWSTDSGNTILVLVNSSKTTSDTTSIKADQTLKAYTGYLKADSNTVFASDRRIISYLYASETKYRADDNRILVNRYYV
jgi:hypothetical protein